MTTILDAYIKQFGQLIIVVSGMSGSNKTEIAIQMADNFKCNNINQQSYIHLDYEHYEDVNDKKIRIWESDDAIDWDKFNQIVIDTPKNVPLIISGTSFNKTKITFQIDYHIHLSLNKQQLIHKRHEYIEKHKDETAYKDMLELDEDTEKFIINKFIYPYSLSTTDKNNVTIHKFIKIEDMTTTEIMEIIMKSLFKFIEHKLYDERHDLYNNNGEYEYKQ